MARKPAMPRQPERAIANRGGVADGEARYQFSAIADGPAHPRRCLTVWGGQDQGMAYPVGQTWDRQPISGKRRRKSVSVPVCGVSRASAPKTVKHPAAAPVGGAPRAWCGAISISRRSRSRRSLAPDGDAVAGLAPRRRGTARFAAGRSSSSVAKTHMLQSEKTGEDVPIMAQDQEVSRPDFLKASGEATA